MRDFEHMSCFAFMALIFIVQLGLNMENNDSRLLSIPKTEFIRVMREILEGSRSAGDQVLASDIDGVQQTVYDDSPRTEATRLAQTRPPGASLSSLSRRKQVKSDSFFFLQRALQEREARQKTTSSTSNTISPRLERRKALGTRAVYGAEDFYSTEGSDEEDDEEDLRAA